MTNFYSLSWKSSKEIARADYVSEDTIGFKLIPELEGKHSLKDYFQLIHIKETRTGLIEDHDFSMLEEVWLDYLPNSLAWPLMSGNMRSVIEEHLSGDEDIDWIECVVKHLNEQRKYFILRFNTMHDVLDENKTMFVPNTNQIIKAVFSISKINSLSIFVQPSTGFFWKISRNILLNETLKKAFQKKKLSGLVTEKTRIA